MTCYLFNYWETGDKYPLVRHTLLNNSWVSTHAALPKMYIVAGTKTRRPVPATRSLLHVSPANLQSCLFHMRPRTHVTHVPPFSFPPLKYLFTFFFSLLPLPWPTQPLLGWLNVKTRCEHRVWMDMMSPQMCPDSRAHKQLAPKVHGLRGVARSSSWLLFDSQRLSGARQNKTKKKKACVDSPVFGGVCSAVLKIAGSSPGSERERGGTQSKRRVYWGREDNKYHWPFHSLTALLWWLNMVFF